MPLNSFSQLSLLVGDIFSHFLEVKSWAFGFSTFSAFRNPVCSGSKLFYFIYLFFFLVTKLSYSFVTIAHQAPLSMGFSRQGYWCGLPFPSPGDPPNPGIKPVSPALEGGFFTVELPTKPSLAARAKSNLSLETWASVLF